MHKHILALVGLMFAVGLLAARPVLADEPALAGKLQQMAHIAHEGVEAAEHNNPELMQLEYTELHELWENIEDDVKAQNPTAYVELEGALDGVKEALAAEPLNPAAVEQAYEYLLAETNEIAAQFGDGDVAPVAAVEATPAELVNWLAAAESALANGDTETANAQFAQVVAAWPGVEGEIAARSQDAYTAIETNLGRALAALRAEPVDQAAAATALEELRATLSPFAIAPAAYTMFDAAAIILREGLEALLVIVALLAFLNRSGNSHRRGWIWLGGGAGVLASIVAAFGLQAIFNQVSAGQNRELIEGVTGLVAAVLLFYVSYWLHSKSNLSAWRKYIDERTSQALARGSLWGLALLAFLAVFREGAETAVFYLGMAPSISVSNLVSGIALGVGVLAVAAVLMLWLGVKLPLRLFFRVAGLLVFYLGFKFVGHGIHALQIAGVLPASLVSLVPTIPAIGIYPTWESLVPQLVLLAAAAIVLVLLRQQEQSPRNVPAA